MNSKQGIRIFALWGEGGLIVLGREVDGEAGIDFDCIRLSKHGDVL